MKITKLHTQIVRLPAQEPLAGGPVAPGATRDIVTLRMMTDQGLEGVGLTYYGGFYGSPMTATLQSSGHRGHAPTYASGALMRSYSLAHVSEAAPRLAEKGFRQMKMQLALPENGRPAVEVSTRSRSSSIQASIASCRSMSSRILRPCR